MPDRKLDIVFRNPHPQRSPVRGEFDLFRRDGSSAHIDHRNRGDFHEPEESTTPRAPGGTR